MLPLTLAAFFVLRLYVESGVSVFATIRALFVALALGLAIWIAASAALRDPGKATLAATFALFGIIAWRSILQLTVAGALVLLLTAVVPRLIRVRFPWRLVTPAANGLAFILVLALVIRGAQNGTFLRLAGDAGHRLGEIAGRQATQAVPVAGAPDVYIIMLEDYPRSDTLKRLFGFDNGQFLSGLADRGLIVSTKSRSNYSTSALTLLTMYQARHIEAIPQLDGLRQHGEDADLYPILQDLINDSVVFETLRRSGYTIIAASSGFEQLALRGADRFFDSGQLNDFEAAALGPTLLATVGDGLRPGIVGEQHRSRVLAEFEFLSQVARENPNRPRLVFIHVPLPHPPVVVGPQGEPVDASLGDAYLSEMADPSSFRDLYVGQLEYLNALVLRAIDDLNHIRRPSITIVMSDEGIGIQIVARTSKDPVDAVGNLFAARGLSGEDLFGPAITPVNIFPIILDRYLGATLPHQSDRNFVSGYGIPFQGFDIPNTDALGKP